MPGTEDLECQERLHLFGRFRLTQPGADCALPGRKACAMLAYLALAPDRTATREHLSGLLWTDRGAEQARASLRQSIKELRHLPPVMECVTATRSIVTLEVHAPPVDLHEMHQAAHAGNLGALAMLLEHSGGELLEDFLDVSPGFDDWLREERPRQLDLLVAVALEAVEADGFADMKNARSILRSLDRLDPVNEAVVRLGMRLDYSIGDGASLHRRYRQLCDRLESEFNALPSEDTRKLYHSLVSSRTPTPANETAAPPPPRQVVSRTNLSDMIPLVMVARLQAQSPDGQLSSLSDFLAADVRASLSRMRGICVLSVDEEDIDAALRQSENALGLYLLSGSLRQIGASVRITVQLANAATRIIVWSDSFRFDEAGEDLIDTVVSKATGAVLPAIDRDLETRLDEANAEIGDERAVYTRARILIRGKGQLDAVNEGVKLLEHLVETNPRHLGARLLLMRMYHTDFWQQICGHDVKAFRTTSERHLQAAAAIEPGHFEVRIGLAWHHLRSGNFAAAKRDFLTVQGSLPHEAEATNMCAFGLCLLGALDDAERLMQRTFFLTPFPPSDYHADYAFLLSLKHEHEAAEDHFEVSGESGLLYTALRLANGSRLNGSSPNHRFDPMIAGFRDNFHRAWRDERPPAVPDVLDWLDYTVPIAPEENRQWVRSGLEQMIAPMWPANL